MVVSGQLGDGFLESAQALASAFYENEVPGYAVAICHASVLNGIVAELERGAIAVPGKALFGAAAAKRGAARTSGSPFKVQLAIAGDGGSGRSADCRRPCEAAGNTTGVRIASASAVFARAGALRVLARTTSWRW